MKFIWILISSLLFSTSSFAVDATIKIEKDVEHRARIALVDGSAVKDSKIFEMLMADLKISGHFLADSKHHKGDLLTTLLLPNLKSQEYVFKYSLIYKKGVTLKVRLLKTSDSKEIFKRSYSLPDKKKLPFLIHKSISDINNVLRYPSISWINRYVVYSVYSAPKKSYIKLADYTFTYKKTIVQGGLNLFPKWGDLKQRTIYYTSYNGILPTLYRLNIYSGSKTKIVSSEGMLVCSDVSKNGTKLLLTMAPNGQADVYEFSVASKSKKRVTKFKGIDVNARYTDNEKSIVFISNRLGYANVFKKPINSSRTSTVVHHGKNNNACDSHKNSIVYSSRESNNAFSSNTFNLYLTSSKSRITRPLTTRGANYSPRFSTDGSVILYLKNSNSAMIGYTNLNSRQSVLFPIRDRKIQSIDW